MPFVAEFDGRRVDLTMPDVPAWSEIWRQPVGERLRCPECHATVRAKQMSLTGTRFVAHVGGTHRECRLAGESFEHLQLKLYVVEALRRRGWLADPEVAGDGWRADVLARPDANSARTIVFEIQLSTQTVDETIRRQQLLASSVDEVVWLVRRRPTWMRLAPTWWIRRDGDRTLVVDGIFSWDEPAERFTTAADCDFGSVLDDLLAGSLRWDPHLRTFGPCDPARLRSSAWLPDHGDGGWVRDRDRAGADELRALLEQREARLIELLSAPSSEGTRDAPTPKRKTSVGARSTVRQRPAPRVSSPLVSPSTNVRDREIVERRRHAVVAIQQLCTERSWSCQVLAGNDQSYFGSRLVIEGRLVIVEPTGVREGRWPGAVVIGNPQMAYRKNVTDVSVIPLSDFLTMPSLGSGDPAAVGLRRASR